MIPQIIWNIWISDKEEPEHKSWDKAGCVIENITKDSFPNLPVFQKLVSEKRWMAANHYMRFYLLYTYGGIYLDSDVEVIKPFGELLNQELMIGREDEFWVNCAVMGSVQGNKFIKQCLDEEFDYDTKEIVLDTSVRLVTKYKKMIPNLLAPDYFYPYHYTAKFTPECITENTRTIHYWSKLW